MVLAFIPEATDGGSSHGCLILEMKCQLMYFVINDDEYLINAVNFDRQKFQSDLKIRIQQILRLRSKE
jgi:hypothetical protein